MRTFIWILILGLCGCGPYVATTKNYRDEGPYKSNLREIKEGCFAAKDLKSFQELNDACNSKDQRTVQLLMKEGRITVLSEGTKVHIVYGGAISKIKVKVQEDDEIVERDYLISEEFLK